MSFIKKFSDFFYFMSCRYPCRCRFFFEVRLQSSLCHTPIRIEATPREHSLKRALPRYIADQKTFGSVPGPLVCFQFLWFFTSPVMAPGPGSKDAGNSYYCWVRQPPIKRMVSASRCIRFTAALRLHAKVFSGMNGTLSLMM